MIDPTFFPPLTAEADVMELYDALATFPAVAAAAEEDQAVPDERRLIVAGTTFEVSILPAVLQRQSQSQSQSQRRRGETGGGEGGLIRRLPGPREERVERMLRHMVATQAEARGRSLNDYEVHGLDFRLCDLVLLLRHAGSQFSVAEVCEALEILNGSFLRVKFSLGRRVHSFASPFIPTMQWQFPDHDPNGSRSYVVATFNSLSNGDTEWMSRSALGFFKLLGLKSSLARWLAGRAERHWLASLGKGAERPAAYRISYFEMLHESGVRFHESGKSEAEQLAEVRAVMEEVAAAFLRPVQPFEELPRHRLAVDGRLMMDPVWILHADPRWVDGWLKRG